MSEKINEQISALVDGELDQSEQDLLLRRMLKDDTLRDRLARYQVASDALRGEFPGRIDPAFHHRVAAALEDEPLPESTVTGTGGSRMLRPFAGVALAASVAVVAVVSLQNIRSDQPDAAPVVAAAPPAPQDYIRAEGVPVPVAPGNSLDAYLVNHNEYAVNRGMGGMLPYVRIVGQGQASGGGGDTQ